MKKALLIMTSLIALVAGEMTFALAAGEMETAVQKMAESPTAREAMQKYLNLSGDALNAKNVIEQISKYGEGAKVYSAIQAFAAKTAANENPEQAAKEVFTKNGKIVESTQLTANVDNRPSRISNFLSGKTSVPAAGTVGEVQTSCSVDAFNKAYADGLDSSEASQFARDQQVALQESGKMPVTVGNCNGGVVKYGPVAKRNLAKIVHMLVQAHQYGVSMWNKAYKAVMGASDDTAVQAVHDFQYTCDFANPVGA